jgi:hypothetical protein
MYHGITGVEYCTARIRRFLSALAILRFHLCHNSAKAERGGIQLRRKQIYFWYVMSIQWTLSQSYPNPVHRSTFWKGFWVCTIWLLIYYPALYSKPSFPAVPWYFQLLKKFHVVIDLSLSTQNLTTIIRTSTQKENGWIKCDIEMCIIHSSTAFLHGEVWFLSLPPTNPHSSSHGLHSQNGKSEVTCMYSYLWRIHCNLSPT